MLLARWIGLLVLVAPIVGLLVAVLVLMMLTVARRIRLIVTRRIGRLIFAVAVTRLAATHHGMTLVVVIPVIAKRFVAGLCSLRPIERRLTLPELLLGGGDHAEIMLGMLVIIFCGDRISGTLRIAGELDVFFSNV